MKRVILVLLLLKIFPLFAQEDSSSALEILYSEAKRKDEELNKYRRFGVSVFAGMGTGGNDLKKGFAFGASARTHYYGHTFNFYISQVRKDELLYGKSYTYSLFSNNVGLVYGPGLHTRNFTASFGAGVGYYNTSIDRHIVTLNHPSYDTYRRVALCFGAQASLHEKLFGVTFQVFYNTANPFTNVTTMGGIEFILK